MAKTISFVKGKGSINHNNREFIAKNVDSSRTSMNVIYVQIPIEKAYEEIFGKAVADYNAKQKRNDRKIGNYLSKVKQSKNNEKVFYENVVQIGKRDDTGILDENGNITEAARLAKEVLDEYARTFQERNPNLILFNAVLHMDEATPHLHLDYIPVAHGYKTGLSTRNSLSKGLQEMGIAPAIGKNDTETMHWQKRERDHIAELCKARGIETEVLGIVRDNYTIPEYKAAMREKEEAEAELKILNSEKEEAISQINSTDSQIVSNYVVIDEQEETLKLIKKQIEDAELRIRSKQEEIDSIAESMKPSDAELQEIESKVTPVPAMFGKEPMVKMPRRLYDRLIARYRLADTLERLYHQYEFDARSLKAKITDLKGEIAYLKKKVQQFTDFIEVKGLVEAFKEFLNPKKAIEKVRNDRAKRIEQRTEKSKEMPAKKKKPSVR
ncbi:MAG: plasmid recombination protein [Eubacterium sp.]|nr:plasmid recombination protein [Eubacterium sp.]